MARFPTIADSNSTQLNVDHHVMYLEIFSSMKFVAWRIQTWPILSFQAMLVAFIIVNDTFNISSDCGQKVYDFQRRTRRRHRRVDLVICERNMNFYSRHRNYKSIAFVDNWELDVNFSTVKLLYNVQHNARSSNDVYVVAEFNTLLARCCRCYAGDNIDNRYTLSSISIWNLTHSIISLYLSQLLKTGRRYYTMPRYQKWASLF